jgi:maltooligosyltrehalose synthase
MLRAYLVRPAHPPTSTYRVQFHALDVEDTALYIYNRLVSLNDVGTEPDRFSASPGTGSTIPSPSWRSRSRRPASPTSTRAPSCWMSAWWTRTTAARDYARRRHLLRELDADETREGRTALARLVAASADDRLKLYATTTMLRFRRHERAIFDEGTCAPLTAGGQRARHVFADSPIALLDCR